MAACTALTDANVFPHPNMTAVKQQLNEHCLQHGATLPLYYTTITQNVLNNNEIYKCAVRSYIRSALSDSSHPSYCNGPDDLPTQLDERVFYADIVEAECKPQRTRDMSVEAAAKLMLEKLGVQAEKPCCDENTYMSQLEDYAAEWGYTAVYHTTEIVPDADVPAMYDCVVSSECLRDTNQSFVVCSNIRGTFTMDEANESAALNAARLLGIQHRA
uniref:Uncharacterized protein n=1 Tax=Ciona savignyi TaxID=51511 RepID=H2YLE8_CIOSA